MTEKLYKLDGQQFAITETTNSAGICELAVAGLGMKLWVKTSDEIYGYGYRVYGPGGGWKGSHATPDSALKAACQEIIATDKRKDQKELSEDLCDYFEQLS